MDKYMWTRFTQPWTGSVAVILYLCSQSTWAHSLLQTEVLCREQSWKKWYFVCMVNYHLASGSPAECVLTGAPLFFWCSSLKQQCVWAEVRNWKREMGFGSTEAVWMWSREAKQQTHPEFKWIFKKWKNLRVFTSQRSVCHWFLLCICLFHFSFSHCNIFPSIRPSQQNTAGFSTVINCLNSTSDRLCKVIQIPLGVYLYIRYRTVMQKSKGGKLFWKVWWDGDQNEKIRQWCKLCRNSIWAEPITRESTRLACSWGHRGAQWAMTVCFPVI